MRSFKIMIAVVIQSLLIYCVYVSQIDSLFENNDNGDHSSSLILCVKGVDLLMFTSTYDKSAKQQYLNAMSFFNGLITAFVSVPSPHSVVWSAMHMT